jgi:hypothetical protein
MLGFDAEEPLIQKLPHDFAEKDRLGFALSAARHNRRRCRGRVRETPGVAPERSRPEVGQHSTGDGTPQMSVNQ